MGGASSLLFARSAPHRPVRVYESPTEESILALGPEVGGGPLYPPADLRGRAALGGEQTGQGSNVRGSHARARLYIVTPARDGGKDPHPRGGNVYFAVVRETGPPVLQICGGYGDHVPVSGGIAWPARVLVACRGNDHDPVSPGVVDGMFEYPGVSFRPEREVYGLRTVVDAPIDALDYVRVVEDPRISAFCHQEFAG